MCAHAVSAWVCSLLWTCIDLTSPMFRLPFLPSKQEMRGQVFESRLIHLCPGVNERLWHGILTKVLLRDTLTGQS